MLAQVRRQDTSTKTSLPQYRLYCGSGEFREPGRWRFVLRLADNSKHLAVEDVEPELQGERLELFAVVRGLEAIEQPSRVALMTSSVYVREGVRYGVEQWRENGWQWEAFGKMVPVNNADLWQRVARVMQFHQIECRTWRFDPPHQLDAPSGTSARQLARQSARWGRFAGMSAILGSRRIRHYLTQTVSDLLATTGLVPAGR